MLYRSRSAEKPCVIYIADEYCGSFKNIVLAAIPCSVAVGLGVFVYNVCALYSIYYTKSIDIMFALWVGLIVKAFVSFFCIEYMEVEMDQV